MKYGNLTLGQIEAGINKIGGEDAFRRLLVGELSVVPSMPLDSGVCLNKTPTFLVRVDYAQSLDAMIAAGRYDWKNDYITAKRFKLEGDGNVEFESCLFHFDRYIESPDAVKAIEAADKDNPWSPGKIEHVLSFGAFFPEEQRKYPIIALGSVATISGRRSVPVLWESGTGRNLDLPWWSSGWHDDYRFLAVRKVPAT